MATFNIVGPMGSNVGPMLNSIMSAGDVWTQSGPDYQLCKDIYLAHPLGAKIAEKPIELAQSQKREISIQGAGTAADRVREQFEDTWRKLSVDNIIFNTVSLSRVYGAAAVALIEDGVPFSKAVDYKTLHKKAITFNVYDPLNIAGSLVLNQNPMSATFLQVTEIAVSGNSFHRSRARVMMNENPIYISYTNSAFGYTGRSVYQRALLPLKSFVQTMQTDDLVSVKAGVIVAMIKQAGSFVNQRMRTFLGFKRDIVKEARNGNVISIGTENEKIESLNLQNLDGPFQAARKNIIENIASAVPMPAQMLTEESFSTTFSEGSEDSKAQARYIDRFREKMESLYTWFDKITWHRAWTPEFFDILKAEFPDEFEDMEHEEFFWKCANSFKAQWPSLLKEPDSELVKVDEVKLKAVIAWVEVLLPNLPQDQKAEVIKWANDQFNELKLLFGSTLQLDYEAIAEFEPATPPEQFGEPKPFSHDADDMPHDTKQALENMTQTIMEYLAEVAKRKQGARGKLQAVK